MPVSKNRKKKSKKPSTGNTRSLFRRDARRVMRSAITSLQKVTDMRTYIADNFKEYPKDVLSSVEAEEKVMLEKLEKMEVRANKILDLCNVDTKTHTEWEVEDMMDVSTESQLLESESEEIINKSIEAAASLQI